MITAERIHQLTPAQQTLLLERLGHSDQGTAEKEIAAYLVCRPEHTASAETLRTDLAARLPDFMVPSHFVFLGALPLTPNGKVDRNALPKLKPETRPAESAIAVAPPRNETEMRLTKLWQEVLRLENVGVEDNFFRLGGHSLLALQLMARVREVFKADLPLKTLFESPTIAGLAQALARFSKSSASQPIRRIHRPGSL
jgi:acyl carrier protein